MECKDDKETTILKIDLCFHILKIDNVIIVIVLWVVIIRRDSTASKVVTKLTLNNDNRFTSFNSTSCDWKIRGDKVHKGKWLDIVNDRNHSSNAPCSISKNKTSLIQRKTFAKETNADRVNFSLSDLLNWVVFNPHLQRPFTALINLIYKDLAIHRLMCYEMLRVRSFDQVVNEDVSVVRLAQAGFYLVLNSDGRERVSCFHCQSTLFINSRDIWSDSAHGQHCRMSHFNVPLTHGMHSLKSSELNLFTSLYSPSTKAILGPGGNSDSFSEGSNEKQTVPRKHDLKEEVYGENKINLIQRKAFAKATNTGRLSLSGTDMQDWMFFNLHLHRPVLIYPLFKDSATHRLMCYEMLRLRSFEQVVNEDVSVARLAQAGFYLVPDSEGREKVSCFHCQSTHFINSPDIWSDSAHGQHCRISHDNIPLMYGTQGLKSSELNLFTSLYSPCTKALLGPGGNNDSFSEGSNEKKKKYGLKEEVNEEISANWLTSATVSPFELEHKNLGNDHRQPEPLLDLSGAAYPQYATLKSRLDTFQMWDPNHSKQPKDLADLGFFYAGYSDCARCFNCGLGLKYWRPDDEAAYQHARFRPGCLYNQFIKGKEFVDMVQEKIAAESQSTPVQAIATGTLPNSGTDEGLNSDRLMSSEAVKQVLQENWPRSKVMKAGEKLIRELGEECLVYSILIEVLANMDKEDSDSAGPLASSKQIEDPEEIGYDRETESQTSVMAPSHNERMGEKRVQEAIHNADTDLVICEEADDSTLVTPQVSQLEPQIALRLLEREHEYMKSRLNCRVCGKNKIGCVYLPCSDVVACTVCGDLASTCVLCGKVIDATANIFIS